MGLDGGERLDDGDGGGGKKGASVSCSICLDVVMKNGERSWAKLQCGHQFHLECIGSAFNAKGAMQCPNCRKVEKGQWLYANGSHSLPEFHIDDWTHDDDLNNIGYSEMSFGVPWCPFGGLARIPSSFEEGDLSSGPYHDLPGQHVLPEEHTPILSAGHPCPYMAYVGPVYPSPSNANGSNSESSNSSNNRNGPVTNEMSSSYTFPAMDAPYHSWEDHTSTLQMDSRIGNSGQASIPRVRVARPNSEIPRSGSFMHPFIVGHRAGSSVASPMLPPHPSSVARALGRIQALEAYFQQPSPSLAVLAPVPAGTRRSSNHRGLSQVGPIGSSSMQNGGFYFFPPVSSGRISQDVNLIQNQLQAWEQFHLLPSFSMSQVYSIPGYGEYGPFLQATTSDPYSGLRSNNSPHRHATTSDPDSGPRSNNSRHRHATTSGPDSGMRSNNFRHRRATDRTPSQNGSQSGN